MKIELDIGDITREHLVDAMATKLLATYVVDDEGNAYPRASELAEHMQKVLSERITKLADEAVRAHFDETIKARIAATVDEVLAEGWVKTDHYGNRLDGEVTTLKGRINEIITEKKSTGYDRTSTTLAERLVLEKVREVFTQQFNNEIDVARKSLREQLDAVVSAKFVETIKAAMGVR